MSVPHFCGIHPHESSSPATYLKVDKRRIDEALTIIRERINNEQIVIGLNWKGNPLTERSNLKGRSMPLEALTVLADLLPNAVFVSLQKGAGSEELEGCSFRSRFTHNQPTVSADWCFIKTSAYILACDFIITTDTSIAHLSGALGKSTHLLLAHKPEWRWCGSGSKSRWYPSVALYKQVVSGDWRQPVREAAAKIQHSLSAKQVATPMSSS
jgi:ADP-heptose:LPS heptosyltransferase